MASNASDGLEDIFGENLPAPRPDDWLSEQEAKQLFGLAVVCIVDHPASYQGTGTVRAGDTGQILEIDQIGAGSGCWLVAVEWNRRSETKDDPEPEPPPLMHGYGREFFTYCRVEERPA